MSDTKNETELPAAQPLAPAVSPAGPTLKYTNRLSILGLVLSAALEFVHAKTFLQPAADSFCSVGQKFDCAAVAASKYSVFMGVPWALWGVIGFLALFIASLRRSYWLLPLSAVSAIGSLALLLVSVFLVGSVCYLCEATHLVSWLLFYFVWKGRSSLVGKPTDLGEASAVLAAPAGLALGLMFFLPNYWASFSYRSTPPFSTGVTDDGHPWIGAEKPEVTLEEYVDYSCGHCRAQSARTLRALSRHPELRVIRRQQPRMRCKVDYPETCKFARLALCAQDQDKFWRADRWLFAHADPRADIDIEKMIADLDLDGEQLRSCYVSEKNFERANEQYRAAVRGGIRFVPGHKVDGKRIEGEALSELLD